jgi:hypothetical protein
VQFVILPLFWAWRSAGRLPCKLPVERRFLKSVREVFSLFRKVVPSESVSENEYRFLDDQQRYWEMRNALIGSTSDWNDALIRRQPRVSLWRCKHSRLASIQKSTRQT